jgi:hypothetical protein
MFTPHLAVPGALFSRGPFRFIIDNRFADIDLLDRL